MWLEREMNWKSCKNEYEIICKIESTRSKQRRSHFVCSVHTFINILTIALSLALLLNRAKCGHINLKQKHSHLLYRS